MSVAAGSTPDPSEVEAWLCGTETRPPAPAHPADPAGTARAALPLAHAIRQAGHAAWNTEPQRAVQAAQAIGRLLAGLDAAPAAAPPPGEAQAAADAPAKPEVEGGVEVEAEAQARAELQALAAWTAGIAEVTQGRIDAALAPLRDASALLARIGRPLLAAQAQVPQVMVLTLLGRPDEAAEVGRTAAEALARLGDLRSAAKVSLNLGSLQHYRDDYAAAARHYREAAVRFARIGDVEHSVMADIGLGDALASIGDLDEADRIYDRAAMRARTRQLTLLQALAAESAALLALARGRYAVALHGLESARDRYAELGLDTHRVNAEQHLGDAYLELRLLPEAMALLDGALERLQTLGMPDEQAWTQMRRGRALAALGRSGEAEAALLAAGALFAAQDSAVGQGHVALARAALALARDEPEAALALAQQAQAWMQDSGQADGLLAADAASAEALLAAGRLDEAGAHFERLLDAAAQRQRLPLLVQAHTGLGLIAERRGQAEAAGKRFAAAVERFEAMRRALPGDDLRSSFLADQLRPYDGLLRLALRSAEAAADGPGPQSAQADPREPAAQTEWQARAAQLNEQARARAAQTDGQTRARAALLALERSRARALGERLLGQARLAPVGQGGGAAALAAAPATSNEALRARLRWLYGRQRRAELEGDVPDSLAEEIRRAEQALLAGNRRERLSAAGGPAAPDSPAQAGAAGPAAIAADAAAAAAAAAAAGVAALPAGPAADAPAHPDPAAGPDGDPLTDTEARIAAAIDGLAGGLAAQEALVAFGLGGPELLACVIRQGRVTVHRRLADWPAVLQAVQGLKFQLDALRHGDAGLQAHLPLLTRRAHSHLARLHGLVWAGLLPALAGVRRLLVVPVGALAELPHAAVLAAGASPGADGETTPPPIVALVGSVALAWHGLRRPMAERVGRVLALGDDRRLAHAAVEAQAVAAAWPGGRALTGPEASQAALLREAASADILHLACHAVFRQDSPLFSSLHLADGPLTAEQVERLALPPQLVVLSACETAMADQQRGDERFGLVRSFLLAGAARVAASLWPVDDAVTRLLMQRFHAELGRGHPPSEAMHLAQQALKATHPHPFHWAGFTLHGGW